MIRFTRAALPLSIFLSTAAMAQSVTVTDTLHDTAGNFLAYTEFELSGEPLAESLGLDLDILDPDQLNQPSDFDYAAGIASYEYSEEATILVDLLLLLLLLFIFFFLFCKLARKHTRTERERGSNLFFSS